MAQAPSEKAFRAMLPYLHRTDVSAARWAWYLVRVPFDAQEKLGALIDLILISWAQESRRSDPSMPMHRWHKKAAAMCKAAGLHY